MLSIASITREDLRAVIGVVEHRMRRHLELRVDLLHSRGHDFRLLRTDEALQRMELAIEVRDADLVEVDERDLTDARAHDRLRGPGAHAAQADDHDMRAHQLLHPMIADQATHPVEAAMQAIVLELGLGHWKNLGKNLGVKLRGSSGGVLAGCLRIRM
jgi:hypothetical protein